MNNKSLYNHYKDFAFCHVCGAAMELSIIFDASDEGPHKGFDTGLNLYSFICNKLTNPLQLYQEPSPHLARNHFLFVNSYFVIDDQNSILNFKTEGYGNIKDFLNGESIGVSISCRNGAPNGLNHMFNTLHEKVNFDDSWLITDKLFGLLNIEKIYLNWFDNNQNIIMLNNNPCANSGYRVTYNSIGEYEICYQPYGKEVKVKISYDNFLLKIKKINHNNIKLKLDIFNLFS